jgi:hypothetical protein
MIHPHKIGKAIKNFSKWLIITNYGRFVLGGLLTVIAGIFSPHSTIDFLSTDYIIFDHIVALGILILIGQFLWVVIRLIFLWIYNKK